VLAFSYDAPAMSFLLQPVIEHIRLAWGGVGQVQELPFRVPGHYG
jgi:hypothetical protein